MLELAELAKFVPEDPFNFSRVKAFAESPIHFVAACLSKKWGNDDNEKPAWFREGSGGHCLLFEPQLFDDRFALWDGDRRTKKYKAWAADQGDKTILTSKEVAVARGIANGIKRHPLAASLILEEGAIVEQRMYWTDPETGLKLSGQPDVRLLDLSDLKSSGRKPKWFEKWAVEAHYPEQLAMYHDGMEILEAAPRAVYMIFVENSEPFDVIVYELGEEAIDYGRRGYRRWLRELARCLEKGQWHGRAPDVVPFEIPEFHQHADAPKVTMGGKAMFA